MTLRNQLPEAGSLFINKHFFAESDPHVLMVGEDDQPWTGTDEKAYPKSLFNENDKYKGRPNAKLREVIETYMGLDEKGEYKAGSHILQMDSLHRAIQKRIAQFDADIKHLQHLLLQVELIKVNRQFFTSFLRITPNQVDKLSPQLRSWSALNAMYKLVAEIQGEKLWIETLIRTKTASIKDYCEDKDGIEEFKSDIEKLQTDIKNLQQDTQQLDDVANAVNRVISRLAENNPILAVQAPKPKLSLRLEAEDVDMKLSDDEKKREAERKDPVTQLLEERKLSEVMPIPSAFLNASGQIWKNPMLQLDGTTVDIAKVPKISKSKTLKQPILDLTLKRAMQQYRVFRDAFSSLQQTLLAKNKVYATLKAQLADVDVNSMNEINLDLPQHTRDLTQITEYIVHHQLSLSGSQPVIHQSLVRLIEIEDELAQHTDAALKQEEKTLKSAIKVLYANLDKSTQASAADIKMEIAASIVPISMDIDKKEEAKKAESTAFAAQPVPMTISKPQPSLSMTQTKESLSTKLCDQKTISSHTERSQTLLEKIVACSPSTSHQKGLKLRIENTIAELHGLQILAAGGKIKPAQIWVELFIGPAIRARGDNIVTAALKTNHPKILSHCLTLLKYIAPLINRDQYREIFLSESSLYLALKSPEMLDLYIDQLIYTWRSGIITSSDIFALLQSRMDDDGNSLLLNALRLADPRIDTAVNKRKYHDPFMYDTTAEWLLEQISKLHKTGCLSAEQVIALLNQANEPGWTALHNICNYNHVPLFRKLIKLVEQVSYQPNRFGKMEFNKTYFDEQIRRLANNHLVDKPRAVPNVLEISSPINRFLIAYRKGPVDYSFQQEALVDEPVERPTKSSRKDKDRSDQVRPQDIAHAQPSTASSYAYFYSSMSQSQQEKKLDFMDVSSDAINPIAPTPKSTWKSTEVHNLIGSHAKPSQHDADVRSTSTSLRIFSQFRVVANASHSHSFEQRWGIDEGDFEQIFKCSGSNSI